MSDLGELVRGAVEAAEGTDQVEAYAVEERQTEVSAHGGEVEGMTFAESRGVGVRVIRDERLGYAWAADPTPEEVRVTVERARRNAALAEPDPANGLPAAAPVEPMPELFRGENENAQTVILNLQYKGKSQTALALAPSTQRRNSFDLVFDLAGQMAFLRPERILRFAFGTPAAIELGMRAALGLAAAPAGVHAANPELNQMLAYLRRSIAPPIVTAIATAGRALSEARGDHIDVTKWLGATHLSAARTALLLTGDLGAAWRVIQSEPIPLTPISMQKRFLDLVAFSATEDYFACRRHLGLTVA